MLDMYIFETNQNIEQLETCILDSERSKYYSTDTINKIFRNMHTIKGSSAMMLFNNISTLAHTMEDLFYFIREKNPAKLDYSNLSNLILDGIDFIKLELYKVKEGQKPDGDASELVKDIKELLDKIKLENVSDSLHIEPQTAIPQTAIPQTAEPQTTEPQTAEPQSHIKKSEHIILEDKPKQQYYIAPNNIETNQKFNIFKANIFFEDGCEMENIRAYTIIHNLKEIANEVYYLPQDIIDDDSSIQVIRSEGFKIYLKTNKNHIEIHDFFNQTIFLKDLELMELENDEEFKQLQPKQLVVESSPIKMPSLQKNEKTSQIEKDIPVSSGNQSIISVNVAKLDKLMDLVGEMVISEAMVTQNPDLKGLELENFQKSARQLHKITSEIQDMVMSIRMVPLSNTFHKMHRIVRDMSKKLNKEVELELLGEETEVDKNIIEQISDPLMHLVRNAIDHGLESFEDRQAIGKPKVGKVCLEAKNAGSDVLIVIKDDGKGLNKDKILKKAMENNLVKMPDQELSDKEIYNLILLPGFSMKENVTEFSGRGVGMDVVTKNIEAVGGVVSIESVEGEGTTITLKIPLTLAIIEGMNIEVGKSKYTIPITAIKESFRPRQSDIINDPDGNEMIMMRGQCYPILRLHKLYQVKTQVTAFTDGIFIMVEQDEKTYCIFADRLLGKQQVVVKSLPNYIKNIRKIKGLTGCTLLGDGSISLILDIGGLTIESY